MDTTKAITHVSLCAGYGGIDLGLRRAIPALRTIAVSEIEAFACANLVAKMEAGLLDPAPIWTDLKTFPWADFHGCVDILSGGYPCQPFSAAGKRLGAEDPRHLWPFIAAGIALMRPSVCFFENVEGHISLGLPDVLQDLVGLGYRTTWGIFSASEVGAPHQRKRVFILAYDQNIGLPRAINAEGKGWSEWRQGLPIKGADRGAAWPSRPGEVADPTSTGHSADAGGICSGEGEAWRQDVFKSEHCGASAWPSRPGEQQFAWEPPRVVADTSSRRRLSAGSECRSGEVAGDSGRQEGSGHQQAALSNNEGCDGRNEETGALVDAKSQRTGQRSELRSEECGSRSALSWDVEQSGEGAMANANELRLEEHRLQHASVSLGSGRGQDAEAAGVPNAQDVRLEEQSQCLAEREADGSGASNAWGVHSCEAQEGRPVEHTSHRSNGEQPTEQQGRHSVGGSGEEAMGNSESQRDADWSECSRRVVANEPEQQRQTQPPLGRDADGLADWLDHAELFTTCDNRTDELRLLGNGVVPATAERAFRVLVGELMEHANP